MSLISRLSARTLVQLTLAALLSWPLAADVTPVTTSSTTVDPVVLRINGLNFLTRNIVPVLAQQAGLGMVDLGRINLGSGTVGAGYTYNAWMDNVRISIPINSQTITAAFQTRVITWDPQVLGQARIAYSLPTAYVSGTLKVRVRHDIFPNIEDNISFRATGISGAITVNLNQSSHGTARVGVVIPSGLTATLGSVSVTDTGWVTEILNVGLSLANLFNSRNVSSVNDGVKLAVQNYLQLSSEFPRQVRALLNPPLELQTMVQGHQFSSPDGLGLTVTPTMTSFATAPNNLTAVWNLDVRANRGGAAPALTYTYLPRPTENIATKGPLGDIEVYIPLSLIDKYAYEAAQQGGFNRGTVTGSFEGIAYNAAFELYGIVRAYRDPSTTGGFFFVIPARINVTAASIQSVNVNATVRVAAEIKADPRNGLYLRTKAVTFDSLTGTIASLGGSGPITSDLRTQLEAGIRQKIMADCPSISLLPKAVSYIPPFGIQLGTVTVGTQYIRVPLAGVTQNRNAEMARSPIFPAGSVYQFPAGFHGRWSTTYGVMNLTVSGGQVTGDYSHDDGRIAGTLSGDRKTLTGTWTEASSGETIVLGFGGIGYNTVSADSGQVSLTLSADGKTFTGRWGYGQSTSSGNWSGTRL